MRIVWLDVSASHAHASLALPLLHNACRKHIGLEWNAVRTTTAADSATLTDEINALQPDVVLATLTLFTRTLVLDILSRLKALRPDCRLIVGGPECLGPNAELLQRHTCLDGAVRGEGEAVLPDLLGLLSKQHEPDAMPGLCWRRHDGEIIDSGGYAVDLQWTTAPPPCTSPFFAHTKPFVAIETSRGCPLSCTFCSSSTAVPCRYRPLAMLRQELTTLGTMGVREIRVLDRTFNLPDARSIELLTMMLDEFPDMAFHLEIRPEDVSAGLCRVLERAAPGRLHLEAGLQTRSPEARRLVGRQGTPEQAHEGVRRLTQISAIRTHVDLLAGLPHQTLADVVGDILDLVQCNAAEIQLETIKSLPGTPFRDHAEDLGITASPCPPYDVMRTTTMTTTDIAAARAASRFLDLFYNPEVLHAPCRDLLLAGPDVWPELLALASAAGMLSAPTSLSRRFTFLLETTQGRFPVINDQLTCAWMLAGLSPNALPGKSIKWKRPIPEEAIWLRGDRSLATTIGVHIWQVSLSNATHWFVYNRSRSQARPLAQAVCYQTL